MKIKRLERSGEQNKKLRRRRKSEMLNLANASRIKHTAVILVVFLSASSAAAETRASLRILETTDIHMHVVDYEM